VDGVGGCRQSSRDSEGFGLSGGVVGDGVEECDAPLRVASFASVVAWRVCLDTCGECSCMSLCVQSGRVRACAFRRMYAFRHSSM